MGNARTRISSATADIERQIKPKIARVATKQLRFEDIAAFLRDWLRAHLAKALFEDSHTRTLLSIKKKARIACIPKDCEIIRRE
jgi:peptidyl-tRNA hydrolase